MRTRPRLQAWERSHGYTIDAARQLRLDHRIGSIEVGKHANLVVLSDDVFGLEPGRLGSVRPTAVLVAGDVVAGAL